MHDLLLLLIAFSTRLPPLFFLQLFSLHPGLMTEGRPRRRRAGGFSPLSRSLLPAFLTPTPSPPRNRPFSSLCFSRSRTLLAFWTLIAPIPELPRSVPHSLPVSFFPSVPFFFFFFDSFPFGQPFLAKVMRAACPY